MCSSSCYTKNQLVSECVNKISENDDSRIRRLQIHNELIELYRQQNDQKNIDLQKKEIEDLKNEEKIRNRILNWLKTKDQNIKIQELIEM